MKTILLLLIFGLAFQAEARQNGYARVFGNLKQEIMKMVNFEHAEKSGMDDCNNQVCGMQVVEARTHCNDLGVKTKDFDKYSINSFQF